jgi:thiamine-phosphate pyrophosphorylase
VKPSGKPLIYLISDGSISDDNYKATSGGFLDLLESAVSAHIPLVQIREKRLSARLLFELTKDAAAITRNSSTKLLVNDRADIAQAAGADGVHLTSRSLSPQTIRKYFPAEFIVGVSTHSVGELESAAKGGASFVVFGPVFESPGKPSALGLNALQEAVDKVCDFPVLALGGVDGSNYKHVLECGAAGFAAMRFLNDAQNLECLRVEFDL